MRFLLVEKTILSNWYAKPSMHGKSRTCATNHDLVSAWTAPHRWGLLPQIMQMPAAYRLDLRGFIGKVTLMTGIRAAETMSKRSSPLAWGQKAIPGST
jgi:hypothetical protein